jgi:hypothetical protein
MKAALKYILVTAASLSPAFAPTITADSSEAQAQPVFHHAPNRPAPRVGPGPAVVNGVTSEGSYNWGGYVVEGTDFTNAKGSWTVPTVDCAKSPNAWVSLWVGIDGWSSDTVEQTGTSTWCNKTTANYSAWYELYPAGSVTIPTITVSPGDKMSAEITYDGVSGGDPEFTLEIKDITTGKSYSFKGTVTTGSAARNSAEWISEAPTGAQGILNLADFTSSSFGTDGANTASDSSKTNEPIGDFSTIYKVTQVDWPESYTEQSPSALTDGSSFKMSWVEYN